MERRLDKWKVAFTHGKHIFHSSRGFLFMRGTALLTLAAMALAGSAGTAHARADLYEHFTLVDPETQRETTNAWVIVRGERIEQVGSGRRPRGNYRRHDMAGLYAMPGLIDAHAHITTGPLAPQVDARKGPV